MAGRPLGFKCECICFLFWFWRLVFGFYRLSIFPHCCKGAFSSLLQSSMDRVLNSGEVSVVFVFHIKSCTFLLHRHLLHPFWSFFPLSLFRGLFLGEYSPALACNLHILNPVGAFVVFARAGVVLAWKRNTISAFLHCRIH